MYWMISSSFRYRARSERRLPRVVDLLLRRVGRMAAQALREAMVERLSACGRLAFPFSAPRIGRRHDRIADGVILVPFVRQRLDVLDDLVELPVGDVPAQHRGAVQSSADDADQVLVARKLLVQDSSELERPFGEIARWRAQSGRRGSLPIPGVAVARAAVLQIGYATAVEHVRGNDAARELHGLVEGRR